MEAVSIFHVFIIIHKFDPNNNNVEEYQRFSSRQGSMINELEYYNGYFIATINGNIYHIDPKDLSTRDLITQGLRSEVSNTTGDIYYLKDSEVYRWKLSDDVNDKPEPGKEKPGKEDPGKEDPGKEGSGKENVLVERTLVKTALVKKVLVEKVLVKKVLVKKILAK